MKLKEVPIDPSVQHRLSVLADFAGPGGSARYASLEEAKERRRAYQRAYMSVWNKTAKGRARSRAKDHARRVKGTRSQAGDVLEFCRTMLALNRAVCTYCKKPVARKDRVVDHVIPLAKGGTNDYDNLTISCATCNNKKSDKWPSEFEREMGIHSWC